MPLANEDSQQFLITAAGPAATLALVAGTSPLGGGKATVTLAKLVGGSWAATTSAAIVTPMAIAINASGQAVVVSKDFDSGGTGLCYGLFAYRC